MKKILTPLLHVAFLIPSLAIAMGAIELMARSFGFLPDYIRVFKPPYIFLTIGIILISGFPIFWMANQFIQRIEKLQNPTISDHLRQAVFFYLILAACFSKWMFSGFFGNEDDLYFLVFTSYSLMAILVNGFILFRKPKV